jgi:toluene methyl-monooxygenase
VRNEEDAVADYVRYYLGSLVVLAGIAGFLAGGYWVWAGAGTFFVLAALDAVSKPDHAVRRIRHPRLADVPLYLHCALMVALYGAFAWRMGSGIGVEGTLPQAVAIAGALASLVWLNAVPNVPVAHELMHRKDPLSRGLAKLVSACFADAHRDIPHVYTHHIHFDTEADADYAPRGITVYPFMWRCTLRNFRELLEAARKRRAATGAALWSPRNLLFWEVALLAVFPVGAALIGGWLAGAVVLAAQVSSKFFLEALNYLQHYGLVRVPGTPAQRHHTWNHLTWLDRAIGYEITTHVDHHVDPDLRFDRLVPHPDAPQMPNLFVCAMSAFVPPLWFRYVAMPRLREWDLHHATPAEQALARAANRAAGWPDWLDEEAPPAPGSASAAQAA